MGTVEVKAAVCDVDQQLFLRWIIFVISKAKTFKICPLHKRAL